MGFVFIMNDAGKRRCEELDHAKLSLAEVTRRYVRMKNMSILCHCSAELDHSTLLYYSVNDMFLGGGDYVLLLFSEVSEHSADQNAGMEIYSRVHVYNLIEEQVELALRGHYTYYSSELDGRLVVLVLFHYGLAPNLYSVLSTALDNHAMEIAEGCKRLYDINVVTYIGEPIHQVTNIAQCYQNLLNVAILHRYIQKKFTVPIFHQLHPAPNSGSPFRFSIPDAAQQLSNAIVEQKDYHKLLDEILFDFANAPLQSTDELKSRLGMLFEAASTELRTRGVRLNADRLRLEQMNLIMSSLHWAELVQWFHHFADIAAEQATSNQETVVIRSLHNAEQYIAEHISSPALTVKEVADALHTSSSSLIQLFQRQLQTTPSKYIRNLRLKQALNLLQTTDLSVQAISDCCGFGSLETFHRVFKAEFGMPPGKLKQLNKANH